ncbi:MAG: hypothetical protein Q8P67_17810 [archaeon]|nr:hypothetical protein [archaeon]
MARASQALNDSREVHERQEMNVVGVAAGSSFSMLGGRCKGAELQVDVLECFHAVPSVGYRVCAVSNPLRAELRGASGAELRSRKEAGEEITMRVATPLFTFLGDTTERVFDDPLVLASPVVIVECTGVEPRQPPEEIRRWGHIHWQQLEPVVRAHPAVVFVLIHFSNSLKEASIFHTVLASALKNVVLWFDSGVVEMAKYI